MDGQKLAIGGSVPIPKHILDRKPLERNLLQSKPKTLSKTKRLKMLQFEDSAIGSTKWIGKSPFRNVRDFEKALGRKITPPKPKKPNIVGVRW